MHSERAPEGAHIAPPGRGIEVEISSQGCALLTLGYSHPSLQEEFPSLIDLKAEGIQLATKNLIRLPSHSGQDG
jgi:hypothetical protein